jgi:hypothetical protein
MHRARVFKAKMFAFPTLPAQAFDLYDVDGSGEIDEHELLLAFKSLGFNSKPAEVRKMVSLYDTDGNGGPRRACRALPRRAASREPPKGLVVARRCAASRIVIVTCVRAPWHACGRRS